MSAHVLSFPLNPTEDETEIPTPIYFQQGDKYLRLNITSEGGTHPGLYPGATAIIHLEAFADRSLHLISRDGELSVVRVAKVGKGHVRIGPPPNPEEAVKLSEIEIVGAVVELYPMGIGRGPRILVHRPERARILAALRPEEGMEYQLVNVV